MKMKLFGMVAVVLGAGALFATPANAGTVVPAATHYANCTAMHVKYKHGVGRTGAKDHVASKSDKPVTNFYVSTAIYNANTASDRDKDGIACEAH